MEKPKWRVKEQLTEDRYDSYVAAIIDQQRMQFLLESMPLGWNEKLELEIVAYDTEWLLVMQVYRAYPKQVLDYISPNED